MPETRRYATALRTEQTAVTRRRILDAAGRLFIERGYLGTTLAGIADAAGVSVQTIYNVVGSKSVLLKAVYDVTLAGDDGPVPMAQRPIVQAVVEATDARECLVRYAVMGRVLGERTLPLVTMLLNQAATGNAELRAFAETFETERAIGTGMIGRRVAERFGLREGLEVQVAADVLWVLTAPDLADRLVNRRGMGLGQIPAVAGRCAGRRAARPDQLAPAPSPR
jgi:AcrR family transcriptional regulator